MNLGAFAVIAALQKRTGVTSSLGTFAGLGRREPCWRPDDAVPAVADRHPADGRLLRQGDVILAAVEAGGPLTFLAVITVINAAVAAFYYLRVVVYMFMREPASDAPPLRHGALLWAGLAAASALTILLGLFPTGLLDAAGNAAQAVVQNLPNSGVPSAIASADLARSSTGFGARVWRRSRAWAASCDSRSATTWSLGCVPVPSEVWSQTCSVLAANGGVERRVVRHVTQDLGDDVQEALVVVGPDLDDHPDHLACRSTTLDWVSSGRNIPVLGVRVEIGRAALARRAQMRSM